MTFKLAGIFKDFVFLSTIGAIFFTTSAYGSINEGIFLNLGLNYETYDREIKDGALNGDQSDTSSSTQMIINFSGGYSFGNSVVAGIKYYNEVFGTKNDIDAGDEDAASMGIMAGYAFNQFLVQFSYLAINVPTKKLTSNNGNDIAEYKDGSGMIFDFSYLFEAGGVMFGPQVSYIQLEYTTFVDNGVADPDFTSWTESKIKPFFVIAATF